MRFKFFRSANTSVSGKNKLDLSFHYHKPESRQLVLYNLGSRRIFNVKAEIINSEGRKFSSNFDHISQKIGILIEIDKTTNASDSFFEGTVDNVQVFVYNDVYKFKLVGNKFIL